MYFSYFLQGLFSMSCKTSNVKVVKFFLFADFPVCQPHFCRGSSGCARHLFRGETVCGIAHLVYSSGYRIWFIPLHCAFGLFLCIAHLVKFSASCIWLSSLHCAFGLFIGIVHWVNLSALRIWFSSLHFAFFFISLHCAFALFLCIAYLLCFSALCICFISLPVTFGSFCGTALWLNW